MLKEDKREYVFLSMNLRYFLYRFDIWLKKDYRYFYLKRVNRQIYNGIFLNAINVKILELHSTQPFLPKLK